MRYRKRSAEAFFTLEAAVLVPLTFFLLACIIHLVFLEYSRCLLIQDAYVVAFRASLLEEGEDRAAFATENAAWQFSGRYFGNRTPEVSAGASGRDVTVELKTETRRSGFDLTGSEAWTSGVSMGARFYDMPSHIRKIARIADLVRAGVRKVTSESGQN